MTVYPDSVDRLRTYQRLAMRNRVVGVLRVAVPIIGLVVLAGLIGQIYLSSLGARFGIGAISVTQEAITVDAPEYAGMLDDGSLYRIAAASAKAAVGSPDLIDLNAATLLVTQADGVTMTAKAALAQLDTINRLVFIAGIADVSDSTGTTSVLNDSVFDWAAQTLTSRGAVTVDYADGTHIDAKGLFYDAKSLEWTFKHATVTLPSTPGAETP